MNLSLISVPSTSSRPLLFHFTSTPSSLSLHKCHRFRVSASFVAESPSDEVSNLSSSSSSTSDVFGGKRELTGVQPLVDNLSASVRVVGSAVCALAAGYGLGLRFGGSRNLALGGAAIAGTAGGAMVYALNACVPEVAATSLHNYVAGFDDPKEIKKEDVEENR